MSCHEWPSPLKSVLHPEPRFPWFINSRSVQCIKDINTHFPFKVIITREKKNLTPYLHIYTRPKNPKHRTLRDRAEIATFILMAEQNQQGNHNEPHHKGTVSQEFDHHDCNITEMLKSMMINWLKTNRTISTSHSLIQHIRLPS